MVEKSPWLRRAHAALKFSFLIILHHIIHSTVVFQSPRTQMASDFQYFPYFQEKKSGLHKYPLTQYFMNILLKKKQIYPIFFTYGEVVDILSMSQYSYIFHEIEKKSIHVSLTLPFYQIDSLGK